MASLDFLELLFELSVAICKQEVRGGQPGSTVLLYFSGIFGFSSDCQQFKLARDFCPSLSGLIYVQRLLLLESALPLTAYPISIFHGDQLTGSWKWFNDFAAIHRCWVRKFSRWYVRLAQFWILGRQDGGANVHTSLEWRWSLG